MAIKRITVSDIAKACGLSRNTVSKVFNGRGSVPESTKQFILQKAQELGYGVFSESIPSKPAERRGNIAVLTQQNALSHHFGTSFMTSFTNQISRMGYSIRIYEISEDEITQQKLPPHLLLKDTAGILTIELFDREYQDMVCSLGLPCVFVDGHAHIMHTVPKCDFVSMENMASIDVLTQHLIDAGAKTIGFVGDKEHCSSFYLRWLSCSNALWLAGLPGSGPYSILEKDSAPYNDPDWMDAQLDRMPHIPDAFVCANDYLAIQLMNALKRRGLSVPDNVMVTGFDGSPESAVIDPPLTTAQIPGSEMGRSAAELLHMRIKTPSAPFVLIHYKTTPIFRGSTR
jgi:LacI family transcriptional regulator